MMFCSKVMRDSIYDDPKPKASPSSTYVSKKVNSSGLMSSSGSRALGDVGSCELVTLARPMPGTTKVVSWICDGLLLLGPRLNSDPELNVAERWRNLSPEEGRKEEWEERETKKKGGGMMEIKKKTSTKNEGARHVYLLLFLLLLLLILLLSLFCLTFERPAFGPSCRWRAAS